MNIETVNYFCTIKISNVIKIQIAKLQRELLGSIFYSEVESSSSEYT